MALVVQKYGGSSLATPKHIQRAARRIKGLRQSGDSVVVVVSAMGHTTDHLIRLAKRTVEEPPLREMDMLLTAGERVSMSLLAMALHAEGIPAISFTGSQSGIITDGDHTRARILDIRCDRIRDEVGKGKVAIVAGFQGVSQQKEVTTLGRGGSDTTAVALSAVLKADRCEILTDVAGIFTADPRVVPDSKVIAECTYDECLELASLGAKMHPRSVELAKRYHVPLRITSSYDETCRGTLLIAESTKEDRMENTKVRGIASRDGFTFLQTEFPFSEVLASLRKHRLPTRFLQSVNGTTLLLVEKENSRLVRGYLDTHGAKYQVAEPVTVISAVGEGLSHCPDFLPDFFSCVASSGAEALLVSQNSLSVSVAVSQRFKEGLCRELHSRFVSEPAK